MTPSSGNWNRQGQEHQKEDYTMFAMEIKTIFVYLMFGTVQKILMNLVKRLCPFYSRKVLIPGNPMFRKYIMLLKKLLNCMLEFYLKFLKSFQQSHLHVAFCFSAYAGRLTT